MSNFLDDLNTKGVNEHSYSDTDEFASEAPTLQEVINRVECGSSKSFIVLSENPATPDTFACMMQGSNGDLGGYTISLIERLDAEVRRFVMQKVTLNQLKERLGKSDSDGTGTGALLKALLGTPPDSDVDEGSSEHNAELAKEIKADIANEEGKPS